MAIGTTNISGFGYINPVIIPRRYKVLEFIRNISDAYIDMDVIPDNETGISLTYERTVYLARVCGTSAVEDVNLRNDSHLSFVQNVDSRDAFAFGEFIYIPKVNDSVINVKLNYNNNNKCIVNGQETAFTPKLTKTPPSINLFRANGYNALNLFQGKIYAGAVTQGLTTVRNVLSVLDTVTEDIGMYDLNSQKLFMSPNGTKFLTPTGSQLTDLGVTPASTEAERVQQLLDLGVEPI